MADPGNGAERSLLAHILSASAFMDCGGEEEEGEEEGEGEEGEEGEEKKKREKKKEKKKEQKPPFPEQSQKLSTLLRQATKTPPSIRNPTWQMIARRELGPEGPDRDEQRTTHRSDCAYRVR
ncbi:hypothetical protein HO133_007539 [Letharia lupina]|uniref:Uncharacterized protein n=1 Tax=Letharia lupina TaxID=560253 RepID=A0A8H6KYY1_9LECA|nr:uncharacterized protein HO133_007539 [Letharia lupina]KAF6229423.1 hypothetical protein HO133_007539 [Letharia lupina]